MNELALFAGAGGGLLASERAGLRTVCAVEISDHCGRVLIQRQQDRALGKFPIWDDVTTFDGRPWRGCVDLISAGFPCQDVSIAGPKVGINGERSGLWFQACRIVREVRPGFVFVENTPGLLDRGMGDVLGSLAGMGFDARWGVFSSCMFGAPHMRRRVFILAYSKGFRPGQLRRLEREEQGAEGWYLCRKGIEPPVVRVAHGVADRLERCRAVGNGQDPVVAAAAFRLLMGTLC